MLDPRFVFVSLALSLLGSTSYAIATVRGRVRPNRVTWSLWAAAPLIGFLAQLDSGVGLPAVQTLGAGLGPLIVLVASFAGRQGTARVGAFDLGCAAVATVALVVWLGLDEAPAAVLFAVLADAVGAAPTVRKAWADPLSENELFYAVVAVSATITLLTIDEWTAKTWAFPGYVLALSLTLITVIRVRRASPRAPRRRPADVPAAADRPAARRARRESGR